MAKTKKINTNMSISEKLDALINLQAIDSEIDRIRTIRGELPLEVQDLEDEVEGLETRLNKLKEEVSLLETGISDMKNGSKESESLIIKYKEKQNNVRNNREFESISKEIEYQELEIKLNEKKTKEAKFKISSKKEILDESKERFDLRKKDLESKQAELDSIVQETEKDEEKLARKSKKAKAGIEDRLIAAYDRLRSNAKNGLSVVEVQRNSCGGCYNSIPLQLQADIKQKNKIIACEHCGRILVPEKETETA
jgi:predicted  nucleic acid-binding Zn-ribbon protein